MVLTGQAMIDAARVFATKRHAGQTRRGGTPYIEHPRAVVNLFQSHWNTDVEWSRWVEPMEGTTGSSNNWYARGMALCWTHDLVEDRRCTWDDFCVAGFGVVIEDELSVLTHATNESYLDYILRIRRYSQQVNLLPFLVKLCDMEHNLSDSPTKAQRTKYELARYILLS